MFGVKVDRTADWLTAIVSNTQFMQMAREVLNRFRGGATLKRKSR